MHDRYGLYLRHDRVRHYYDVQSWLDGLAACCDMVWGFRIHGAMAGVAAGLPSVVLARDFRVAELAAAMALPTGDAGELPLDPAAWDFFDHLESLGGLDGPRFDARRQEVAAAYAREFRRLGVPLHPAIRVLADGQDH